MRILGRDLKKIIREEIGREMHQHAKSETLSKHSGFSEEDDIVNEDDGEYEDKLVARTPGEIAAYNAAEKKKYDTAVSKSKLLQAMAQQRADAEAGTASTWPEMDFGTEVITPDETRDIDNTLPLREGKNITERLMERWLK